MPHPAVTCSNQALSEIYLLSPIRGYKQCKNTAEELCKAANAVLSPGCCSSGWSQCAHTFELLWLPCCQGHSQLPTWTWGLGFLSEGTGMGLFHSGTSTKELEQYHGSSGITLTLKTIFCCPKAPRRPICGSGTGSNLVLLQRFLPTGPVCSPWSTGFQWINHRWCAWCYSLCKFRAA